MKNIVLLVSSFLALSLPGCATTDSATFPEPSANYVPQASYAVSYDKLWDAAMNALDKNQIAVVSSDKSSGIIQTDYIGGPSRLIGLGFGGAQSTRYKYNITIRTQSDGTSKLNVICKIESTITGMSTSSQWKDVSADNAALAAKLGNWLREQIEAEIQK